MPRVLCCVCAIMVGFVGQVCRAQSTPAGEPVAQRSAPAKSAVSPPSVDVPLPAPALAAPSVVAFAPPGRSYPAGVQVHAPPHRVNGTSIAPVFIEEEFLEANPPNRVNVAPVPPCPFCPTTNTPVGKNILLGFTAKWCGPCQKMNPILKKLAAQGHAVHQVDIEAHPVLARRFRINSIPAFVLIAHGKEVARVIGHTSERGLKQLLAKAWNTPAPPHVTRRATVNKSAANKFQIVCDKMELEFDPRSGQTSFQCSGGVTIRSNQFVARAARVTIRNGKLAFDGGVTISVNQTGMQPAGTVDPATAPKTVPKRTIRYRIKDVKLKQPTPAPPPKAVSRRVIHDPFKNVKSRPTGQPVKRK